MPPFEYPHNKKTAEKALSTFSSFASNGAYLPVFADAVRILYGRNYEIITDVNRRMSFFCIACSKTMNSTQALLGHNNSALHLKTADRYKGDYQGGPGPSCSNLLQKYPADSLQYDILHNNSMILGVHLIETYSLHRRSLPYYKCILCGAHGKRDAIYNHIINDKHTDKYIRYSIEINTASISTEERIAYRKSLFDRDGLEVDKIINYTDRALFPFKWEQEGLSAAILVQRNRKFGRFSPSHDSRHRDSDRHSSRSRHSRSPSSNRSSSVNRHSRQDSGSHRDRGHSRVKVEALSSGSNSTDSDDDMPVKLTNLLREVKSKEQKPTKATPVATPGGVIIHRDNTVMKHHQEVQVYTDWAIDRCLLKLNFIVHTSALKSSQVLSQEDVKHCLRMMFSVGNLLHYSLGNMKKTFKDRRKLELLEATSSSLSKMQGAVNTLMAVRWNRENNGDCLGDLRPLWNKRQQHRHSSSNAAPRRESTGAGRVNIRSFARHSQDDSDD